MAKTFDYARDYIMYSNYSDSHNGFIFSTVYLQRGLEVCDYIEIVLFIFFFLSKDCLYECQIMARLKFLGGNAWYSKTLYRNWISVQRKTLIAGNKLAFFFTTFLYNID